MACPATQLECLHEKKRPILSEIALNFEAMAITSLVDKSLVFWGVQFQWAFLGGFETEKRKQADPQPHFIVPSSHVRGAPFQSTPSTLQLDRLCQKLSSSDVSWLVDPPPPGNLNVLFRQSTALGNPPTASYRLVGAIFRYFFISIH